MLAIRHDVVGQLAQHHFLLLVFEKSFVPGHDAASLVGFDAVVPERISGGIQIPQAAGVGASADVAGVGIDAAGEDAGQGDLGQDIALEIGFVEACSAANPGNAVGCVERHGIEINIGAESLARLSIGIENENLRNAVEHVGMASHYDPGGAISFIH